MVTCSFCNRPAEQGLWLRRWRRDDLDVRDAQVSLCARHLRACLIEHRELRRGGWTYG